MTQRISPERAKELLEGDFSTETRQEWAGSLQADFDNFTGAYINGTPGDFALADASYELAQTIAGMEYEYAVQVSVDGESWRFAHGAVKATFDPVKPCWWFRTEEEARDFAKFRTTKRSTARVVRRLVTDVEVVE